VFEPRDADGATGDSGFGVLHGLFWPTANLGRGGPAVPVGRRSAMVRSRVVAVLAFLERRLEGLGVLVSAAARTDDANPESRLIWEIAQDPATVSLRLSALSEDAVGEMVRHRLGPDAESAVCVACHHATGGNPLLLDELSRRCVPNG
jgi:hypothetical protein